MPRCWMTYVAPKRGDALGKVRGALVSLGRATSLAIAARAGVAPGDTSSILGEDLKSGRVTYDPKGMPPCWSPTEKLKQEMRREMAA